jgi:hypothetical protein
MASPRAIVTVAGTVDRGTFLIPTLSLGLVSLVDRDTAILHEEAQTGTEYIESLID